MSDDPDFCDCGPEDTDLPRPAPRPGLSQIPYRVARHSQHVARMQYGLTRQQVGNDPASTPPLAGLATRSRDDPTMALIDAWASSLEVLGFYQERIAQEGFLRTATERMSVLELARAIGYELAPGTSATTHLAFTVEEADDPYRETEVPEGTPVMSVPQEPDTLPQTYETLETITARADWNAIPARQQRPQPLALHVVGEGRPDLVLIDFDGSLDPEGLDPDAYVQIGADALSALYPLDLAVNPLEILQERAASLGQDLSEVTLTCLRVSDVYLGGVATGLKPGDRMLAVGLQQASSAGTATEAVGFAVTTLALAVEKVLPDPDLAVTNVHLRTVSQGRAEDVAKPPRPTASLRFRGPRLAKGGLLGRPVTLARAPVNALLGKRLWTGDGFGLLMKEQNWERREVLRLARTPQRETPERVSGAPEPGLFALRDTVSFFGASAPLQETLASRAETRGGTEDPPRDPYASSWDTPPRAIWTDSQGGDLGGHVTAYLEREIGAVQPEGWVLVEATLPAEDASIGAITQIRALRVMDAFTEARTDFAISGKVTGMRLARADGRAFVPDAEAGDNNFTIRAARAHVVSAPLEISGLPIREDIAEGSEDLTLDRLVLDVSGGQAVALSGPRADAPDVDAAEIALVDEVYHVGGVTRLRLRTSLRNGYARAGLRLNANVALASHGAKVEQILGSGDAAQANQAFALMKTPLTHVPSDAPTGRSSSLVLRVDGVTWTELPSLYEAGPEDEVYTVRIDDDGGTRVVFGDGVQGARLPTGTFNVTAEYRTGSGLEGETAAGTLMQMPRRPLGVRSVRNPSGARGASDPETLDTARETAPTTVRTLDRIVSFTDYADAARRYPGIGKARADLVWLGARRAVVLTVGTESGASPLPTDPIMEALGRALEAQRDVALPLEIRGFIPRHLVISARVGFDRRRRAEDVEAAVADALLARFAFDTQPFAQSITGADVITAIQNTAGVVFARLDVIEAVPEGTAPDPDVETLRGDSLSDSEAADFLVARPGRYDPAKKTYHGAELWLLTRAGLDLKMEAADAT